MTYLFIAFIVCLVCAILAVDEIISDYSARHRKEDSVDRAIWKAEDQARHRNSR